MTRKITLCLRCPALLALILFVMAAACLRAQDQIWQGNDNPTGVTGVFNGNITTGCSYDPYTGNATRTVVDLQVAGALTTYPLVWTRTLNTRDMVWRNAYRWIVTQSPGTADNDTTTPTIAFTVSYPDGREITFKRDPYSSDPFYRGPAGTRERLQQTGDGNDFYLHMSNGGRVYFRRQTGGNPYTFQARKMLDPFNNALVFTYNAGGKLTAITEPAGRYLQIAYNANGYISTVTGSDGQSVTFGRSNYITPAGNVYSTITSATYSDATSASYTYQPSNIDPDGLPLISTCNDVRYPGPMKFIKYTFVPNAAGVVYGQIQSERSGATNALVSKYDLPTHTETTGDGRTRKFTYGLGATYLLVSYTDFKNKTTTLGYDVNLYPASIKDALLNTTTFTREPYAGQITKVTYQVGTTPYPSVSYQYSNANRPYYVSKITDERSNATTITRTTNNRVQHVDHAGLASEDFTYTTLGQLETHTLKNGAIESFTYYATDTTVPLSARGMLWTSTNADGLTSFTYDAFSRVASVIDPLSRTNYYEYTQDGQLQKVTNPYSSVSQFTYFDDNTLKSAQNELGYTTNYEYDEYKRITKVTDPLLRATNYSYAVPSSATGSTYTTAAPSLITLPSGKKTSLSYDANFRKASEKVGFGTVDEATTLFAYDAVGNRSSTTDPRGKQSLFTYDARNRLQTSKDPLGNTTSYEYDAAGNRAKVTLPDTTSYTSYTYDVLNQMLTATEASTQGGTPRITTMTYNPSGSVASVQDAKANTYAYVYDALDRVSSLTYPDATTERYSYDGAGNIKTFTNRAGNVESFIFDKRNRETQHSWSANGETVTRDYFSTNWPKFENGATSQLSFGYNAAGEIISTTQTLSGLSAKTISYTYDLDGNRADITYPNGLNYDYTYTNRNQLSSINDGGATPLASYAYDLAGNVSLKTLRNGISSSFIYDDAERLTSINYQRAGSTIASFAYGYNAKSDRTWVKRENGKGDSYGYDPFQQLNLIKYNADSVDVAPANPTRTVSYAYDPAGNRNSLVDNGVTSSYTPNPLNAYLTAGGQTVTYDGNRNVAGFNGWNYTHDADNNLIGGSIGSTTLSCSYDQFPHLVKKTENGVGRFFIYDGLDLISEYDGSGNNDNNYVCGAGVDEIITRSNSSGTFYYLYDGLGNVTHYTDAGGNVVEKYSYDVFGGATITTASGTPLTYSAYGQRFMFTGRRLVTAFDTIYDFRNRTYSPKLGKFLEPDPIGFGGGINLYGYCGNNASNSTDPLGLLDPSAPGRPPIQTEQNGPNDVWLDSEGGKHVNVGDGLWDGSSPSYPEDVMQELDRVYASSDSPHATEWVRVGAEGLHAGESARASGLSGSRDSYMADFAREWHNQGYAGLGNSVYDTTISGTSTLLSVATGAEVVVGLRLAIPRLFAKMFGRTAAKTASSRAFWVGPDGFSAARASGSRVLQLTPKAQIALDAGNPTLMFGESAAWANGATGQSAKVFIGNGKGYTFWKYEFPQLMKNMNKGSLKTIEIDF